MTSSDSRKLLDEIERGAIKGNADLPELLRKCIALGGQSGSADLREWASRELKGYQEDQGHTLPDYRVVPATLVIDGATMTARIQGQEISPVALPQEARDQVKEEVQFWGPVAELADIVKRTEAAGELSASIGLPAGSALAGLMNVYSQRAGQRQYIERIYHKVAITSIVGILDRIQTNLTELVAEVRAGLPASSDTPDKELMDRAVAIAVYGNRNRIDVRNAVASTGSVAVTTGDEQATETPMRRLMFWFFGIVGVIGTAIGLLTWHPWHR